MSRLAPLAPDQLSPQQRAVFDAIASGPRGQVRGPLAVWLHSADLAAKAQDLGAYCRYGSSLEPRLSELAILMTATHWQAGFEWFAHAPAALKGGLTPDQVEALRLGVEPAFQRDDEKAVYAFADALLKTRKVPQAVYDQAVAVLGERGVVDLTGVLGYYALISMTITAFDIKVPAGEIDVYAG